MKYVNLSGFDIVVTDKQGKPHTFRKHPSLTVRTTMSHARGDDLDNFKTRRVLSVSVSKLPDPVEGTIYIVSNAVMNNLTVYRDDIVAPDMLGAVHNERSNRVTLVMGFRVCNNGSNSTL